jgi:hypothetical protein
MIGGIVMPLSLPSPLLSRLLINVRFGNRDVSTGIESLSPFTVDVTDKSASLSGNLPRECIRFLHDNRFCDDRCNLANGRTRFVQVWNVVSHNEPLISALLPSCFAC